MSSFIAKFRHKLSGVDVDVICMDGYFSGRNYGYELPDGRVLTEEQIYRDYVDIVENYDNKGK